MTRVRRSYRKHDDKPPTIAGWENLAKDVDSAKDIAQKEWKLKECSTKECSSRSGSKEFPKGPKCRPLGSRLDSLRPKQPTKVGIRKIDRISDCYLLGADVAPASNSGVYHASRVPDGLEVVVKRRSKAQFCGAPQKGTSKHQEEQEWCRSVDMLLNLPKNDSIAHLYEVLEDADAYYVVMEKVPGVDLFEAIHSDVKLSPEETNVILYQLLQALKDLHDCGCVHKDLKLENVMLDSPILERNPWAQSEETVEAIHSSMAVKIIDLDTIEAFSPKVISKRVVGTDQYIAQEAYAGRYSPASDIFSAGVIAFRLITGMFPFVGLDFDDWPGENKVGHPKMQKLQDDLKSFNINWDVEPWHSMPVAQDLVRWMLQSDESKRPTVDQALAHSYFEEANEVVPSFPPSSSPSMCSTAAPSSSASICSALEDTLSQHSPRDLQSLLLSIEERTEEYESSSRY